MQAHRHALLGLQLAERAPQPVAGLGVESLGAPRDLGLCRAALVARAPLAGLDPIAGAVGHDPHEPRAKRALGVEALRPVEHAEERLLRRVLGGHGVARDLQPDPIRRPPVALQQHPQAPLRVLSESLHQAFVADHAGLSAGDPATPGDRGAGHGSRLHPTYDARRRVHPRNPRLAARPGKPRTRRDLPSPAGPLPATQLGGGPRTRRRSGPSSRAAPGRGPFSPPTDPPCSGWPGRRACAATRSASAARGASWARAPTGTAPASSAR